MIKTLERKYITTAMAAITVLIVFLLGAINVVNVVVVNSQIDDTMEILATTQGDAGNASVNTKYSDSFFAPFFGLYRSDYDTLMSSNFFIVRYSPVGDSIFVDVTRTSSVTNEEAQEYALGVIQSESTEGKVDSYEYVVYADSSSVYVIFLDTSYYINTIWRIAMLSIAGGIFTWLVMFILVSFLSKKAIQPIAQNIENEKQFITNAGHEIKTPLAIIQSNTEAMEIFYGENKYSKNIKTQTVRLSDLMQQLLLMAKMDEGNYTVVREKINISSLAQEQADSFTPSFELKKVEYKTDIQPDLEIEFDRNQLTQLFTIMLDNAVKYTDEEGDGLLTVKKEGSQIRIQFENSCEAVPQTKPENLFNRFYRADQARTQKPNSGYGVGLSVAQQIVESNKGTIKIEYLNDKRIAFIVTLKAE